MKLQEIFQLKFFIIFLSSLFLFMNHSEAQRRSRPSSSRSRPAMTSPRAANNGTNRTVLRGDLWSIGGGIGFNSINQADINKTIRAAKTSGAANTPEMKVAMEYMAFISYRFGKYPVSIQFRPSYFTQTTTGSGTDGNYNYELTGYTFFPIVRYIPLTTAQFDLYVQAGAGYAMMNGKIANATRKVSFSGASFGTVVGAGVDFCFFPNHCIGAEGNYRYLNIDKNDIRSASGQVPYGLHPDSANGRELEDTTGDNISTFLTGLNGIVAYTYYF